MAIGDCQVHRLNITGVGECSRTAIHDRDGGDASVLVVMEDDVESAVRILVDDSQAAVRRHVPERPVGCPLVTSAPPALSRNATKDVKLGCGKRNAILHAASGKEKKILNAVAIEVFI